MERNIFEISVTIVTIAVLMIRSLVIPWKVFMLFINGPIDDGSIPKGIEPFVVFKRIIHVDRTLPKRVNVEISFEIRVWLFCLQIFLTKIVFGIILY